MSLVFGCYVWVLYWVGGTFGRILLAMSGRHVSVFKNKKPFVLSGVYAAA